ncbi:MAG: hypothetical protein ABEJ68_01420 [Halobacteriaceae archaeon]
MSIDSIDDVELEQDDLTVEKTARPAGDVTHVVFTLTSHGDDPLSVRLVDDVPDAAPESEVGLHPDHRTYWTASDASLVFERTLDPGAEFTTLYGVNSTDPEVVADFFAVPEVTVDPAAPAKSDGGEVRDGRRPAMADIVAAVEDADEDERAALRRALGEGDASGSVDARIRHLQNEVADLSAYREALAEFLDENGGAAAAIAEFEEDVDALRDDVAEIEGTVADRATRLDELEATLGEVRASLDALESEVEAGRAWREGIVNAATLYPRSADDGDEPTRPDPPTGADPPDVTGDEAAAADGEADAEGDETDEDEDPADDADDAFAPADPEDDPLGGVGTSMDEAKQEEAPEADSDDPFENVEE